MKSRYANILRHLGLMTRSFRDLASSLSEEVSGPHAVSTTLKKRTQHSVIIVSVRGQTSHICCMIAPDGIRSGLKEAHKAQRLS